MPSLTPEPFDIDIPDDVLDDLAARLGRTRWPNRPGDRAQDSGLDQALLRDLVGYWRDGFDWRRQEAALNRFAQFRAAIDGFEIHFIHERGKGPAPIPLILTHGWPDSFYRMHKIIPLLSDPAAHGGDAGDAFDVIVPSLPGFAFSVIPDRECVTGPRVAGLWLRLMTDVLGYRRFIAHGGDLGSVVTQELALADPDRVVGIHLTDVPYLNLVRADALADDLSEAERRYVEAGRSWMQAEGAYAALQSTKPATLAPALNDSPAGLAAWIVGKFLSWSDGNRATRITRDELLTNVMIYWVTETIGSSFRLYHDPMHAPPPDRDGSVVEVPTGFAIFPEDIVPAPRAWAERFFTVTRWTEMPRGGHFAALEAPELLVDDLRAFARAYR